MAFSRIRAEFQSRGIPLPHQGARELRTKLPDLELDVRSLRPGESLQRGRADRVYPVPVAALPVQQRGRRLDQPLPNPRRLGVAVLNNRTPHGFQGFVREPVFAVVEQGTRTREVRATLARGHRRLSATG